MYVIGRYKKFKIVLIDGGDGFVCGLYCPEYRRLCEPVCKDDKLTINGRYLRGRYDGLLESD